MSGFTHTHTHTTLPRERWLERSGGVGREVGARGRPEEEGGVCTRATLVVQAPGRRLGAAHRHLLPLLHAHLAELLAVAHDDHAHPAVLAQHLLPLLALPA
eukprot:3654193-Rhodomonas_salina.1